jgi:Trp operon repressor
VTGRWFSPGILVSSTNKTDHHDITEILLKVALEKERVKDRNNVVHVLMQKSSSGK